MNIASYSLRRNSSAGAEVRAELGAREPEFGTIWNRNRPHVGKVSGFGCVPASCVDAEPT